jgi:hypothetical protein
MKKEKTYLALDDLERNWFMCPLCAEPCSNHPWIAAHLATDDLFGNCTNCGVELQLPRRLPSCAQSKKAFIGKR